MKKIFAIICVLMFSFNAFSQDYDPYANTSIGIGYSHMNVDGYKDNMVDFWMLIYGVYFDVNIGTELKDYDNFSDKTDYSINVGYEFPVYTGSNTRVLLGPVIGVEDVGYNDGWSGYDYYGYYDYDCWHSVDSYFNYGVVGGVIVNHLQFNFKATRAELGVGIGYNF